MSDVSTEGTPALEATPPKGTIWARAGLLIRIAVALGLFLWLGTRIDWPTLGSTLRAIDPVRAGCGLLVLWAGLAVAAYRWQRILRALGSDMRPLETVRVFGSGLFLSLFLPTTVGGDVYRLARAARGGFGTARAGVSLVAERGIGLLALILLVSPVVAIHSKTRDLYPLALTLGGGALAVVLGFLLWGRTFAGMLAKRVPFLEPAVGTATWDSLSKQVPAVFALSLVNHLSTVGANYLFAGALGAPLSFWDALALIPLVVLAGQLPISPGGLGVREAGFVFFLGRVGIAKEAALAVGLVYLAALYVTGSLGALLFLIDRKKERSARGVDTPACPP